MAKAQCKGMGPDAFFPERGGHGGVSPAAQEACDNCKVSDECTDYAIRTGSDYGVWGGHIRKRSKTA